jgi:AIPR protein
MDSVESFREELLARVHVRAAADSNFKHSAFAELCGELLEEAEELFDFEPCYFRGKGARNRNLAVDGYTFDDADQSVRIMVVQLSGSVNAESLTRTDAKAQFAAAVAFVEDAIKGAVLDSTEESSPEYGLARELRVRAAGVSRFRFYLASDRVLSEKIKDWPEGEIGGVPAEFHIWDMSRFQRAHLSRSGRDELIIPFGEFVHGGLPCLPASVDTDAYEGYLCVIPGDVLADIYDRYGSRLLEGNVRSFLSTTGKVNKGIQQTLQCEPEMFFAYNNGIAATASSVEIVETGSGTRVTSATDFQIVNGGQTTASMAHARRKGGSTLRGVFVQMKLSVIEDEKAGAFIPLISRYSNLQNKVSDADFFANHEFHRQIEKISRRLRAPARKGSQVESFWFYERARGQYAVELGRLGTAERKRFELGSPRDQIITKTDLAKIENSWRKLPHAVSRGAQKNFLRFAEYVTAEWERDPVAFHDEYFRALVAKTILFRTLERLVPKEDWYDGGYRAQIVTFSIAKLAHIVETDCCGRDIDFAQIWKAQELSVPLTDQLRRIAHAVYLVIVKPESGMQNVTEWCKKELAWQRLKLVSVPIVAGFKAVLVDSAESLSRNRYSRIDANVDAGVDAQTQVLKFGAANWEKLRSKAITSRALTPNEESLLRIAANPKWVPSDKQGKDLVRILNRLKADGFVP